MEKTTQPALAVKNLTHRYTTGLRRQTTVLHNINFEVITGELVSFIGVNGAGKTTLLKTLVGITKPSRGQIQVFGQDLNRPTARQTIGFMPESPAFYDNISARQFLLAVGGMFGLAKDISRQRATDLLLEVRLEHNDRQAIRTFSKGMRQRLGFAQSLMGEPKLLFLDEPLDGLDPLGRIELKQSIIKRQQAGLTVVLCSHILSDIAQMSDRIGIINRGQLLHLASTNSFTKGKDLEQAFVDYITPKL
ncbi:MAG: ABC transporter ATP-binding protein [bacterium]|nr:ABC transporter ATP-binding protein [bacterium]